VTNQASNRRPVPWPAESSVYVKHTFFYIKKNIMIFKKIEKQTDAGTDRLPAGRTGVAGLVPALQAKTPNDLALGATSHLREMFCFSSYSQL